MKDRREQKDAYNAAYRASHREEARARTAAWRSDNPEEGRAAVARLSCCNPTTARRRLFITPPTAPPITKSRPLAAHFAVRYAAHCGFHGFWPPGFTRNGHPVSPEMATLFHG